MNPTILVRRLLKTRRVGRTRSRSLIPAALWLMSPVVLGLTANAGAEPTGGVLSHQKISNTEGGFKGILDNFDSFGFSVASIGDLDGDGVADLAVGAPEDDDGGPRKGAVWVLFLNDDGAVKSHQKISSTEGGFTGMLDDQDRFGVSVASIGDLDADGVADLAVGAKGDDDGGPQRGAVWVLFLNANGTVKSHLKISSTEGGFTGILDNYDSFGAAVASIGDLDADGVADLAVGAIGDDDGGVDDSSERGAVWMLFLNDDGTVKSQQKISSTEGGFMGMLDDWDQFGSSVASIGDLDGDGVADLAVGAYWDDDGGTNTGAVWVLFLNDDGTVKSHQKISDTEGGFTGVLGNFDHFGISVASIDDLDGDGAADLAVGANWGSNGGIGRGAMWILFLNDDGTVKSHQKISDTEGGFTGILDDADSFGTSVASLGDLDADGVAEIAVGAPQDDDGGFDRGAVWVLSFGPCVSNLDCDDGDPCNGDESCNLITGECNPGTPIMCDMVMRLEAETSNPKAESQFTVDVFLDNPTPFAMEVTAYQAQVDCSFSGGDVGSIDAVIVTSSIPCTGVPDDPLPPCKIGACSGATICSPGVIDCDPPEDCIDDGGGLGTGKCLGSGTCASGPVVDESRSDYVFSCSGSTLTFPDDVCPEINVNAAILAGPPNDFCSIPSGETRYLGTFAFVGSCGAAGEFQLDLDEASVLFGPDQTAIPFVGQAATVVVIGGACCSNQGCEDGDPCTVDLCNVDVCEFQARLYGDANNDGARNIIDVICSARVIFQAATTCGGFEMSLDEIDIAPSAVCGDGLLNIVDVVVHARAVFQNAVDECCEQ